MYILLTNPEIEQVLHKVPFQTALYAAKKGCYKPSQWPDEPKASGDLVMAFVMIHLIQMKPQLTTRQQPPASMSSLLQLYMPLTTSKTEQSPQKE
jgi:hypothetical protein